MQNHIGCICSTFLHCAFSNVSSNGMSERRHSCIGCICLIFLLHYLYFSRKYLHWPDFHLSHHQQYFDPSPPSWECCLLLTVSFKLRKWGLQIFKKVEQMKVRVIAEDNICDNINHQTRIHNEDNDKISHLNIEYVHSFVISRKWTGDILPSNK